MNRGFFLRDPFNIAPGATRHTWASWSVLILGAAFLLTCGYLLYRSYESVRIADQALKRNEKRAQAEAQRDLEARRRENDPAALEKARARQSLKFILRTSWSGLFNILENAGQRAGGRVAVTSLAPVRAQAGTSETTVTAVAVSGQVMLDYVRALEQDTHVREVRLVSQQPTQASGKEAVRFQVSFRWDPYTMEAVRSDLASDSHLIPNSK